MYTASIQFGGYANEPEIVKHREKLGEILKQLNIQHTTQFEFLGYNSPFQPVNRSNEVQVGIIDFKSELLLNK